MCTVGAIPMLVLLLAVNVKSERGYIITAPKMMVLGSTEKVCITPVNTIEHFEIRVDVKILPLYWDEFNMESTEVYTMTHEDHCIEVQIADKVAGYFDYRGMKTATLKVVGTSLNPAIAFRFSEEKRIWLKSNKPTIFIQTDKPVYDPGQTVGIRILSIKGNQFLPYTSSLPTVWIENPNGVRIMHWMNVTSDTGLVELALPLSHESVMGRWIIQVELEGQTKNQKFDVKEYVVPKFEVIIKPPPYILSIDERIRVQVCGRYTHGQPVKGEVKAEICLSSRYSFWKLPCVTKGKENTGDDGCVTYVIDTDSLLLRNFNAHYYGAHLNVDAEFTEVDTGIAYNASLSKPNLSNRAFNLKINAPEYFKAGVPFHGEIAVTHPDNSPASGKHINVYVSADTADSSSRIFDEELVSTNGVVHFTLGDGAVLNDDVDVTTITSLTINARVARFRYVYPMQVPSAAKTVRPWFSPSGSFLQLKPVRKTLPVDSNFTFTVHYTAEQVQQVKLFYKVISRGDIVLSDSSDYKLGNAGVPSANTTTTTTTTTTPTTRYNQEESSLQTTLPLSLTTDSRRKTHYTMERPEISGQFQLIVPISHAMSHKSKLLIYYVRIDGEIVADSVSFTVKKKFKNEVKLRFNESEALPGAATQLELTASPGSLCAIGVVDKSVHLMGSGNQLTAATVLNTLSEYDMSSVHGFVLSSTHCDRQHGYWGSSSGYSNHEDSLSAFKDSNIVIMTNVLLETRPCVWDEDDYSYYNYHDHYFNYRSSEPPPTTWPLYTSMAMFANTWPAYDYSDDSYSDWGRLLTSRSVNQLPNEMTTPAFETTHDEDADVSSSEDLTPLVEIRTYFPETWLWKLENIGETGKSTIDVEVPHTITEWIGSGFCTSSEHGVGVSETTHLTAFQPFFLSYTLPYSVIRGEKVPILVTVFNYVSQCLSVDLTMTSSKDFEMLEENAVKRACVCGSESRTVIYNIVPNTLGEITITVQAESVIADDVIDICGNDAIMSNRIGARDALSDKLLVESEGIEEEYTRSVYYCPKRENVIEGSARGISSGESDEGGISFELGLPENVIEGSARGTLTIIGDLMGTTLSGLEKLLKIPYGCGEQNMVSFAPNIFVLHYLTHTNQATKVVEDKAHANMLRGYQRQLGYRHSDGSYSAFGKRDLEGSTWLTAFVVKSFAQSRRFITIDEDDLRMSIAWFKRQQNLDTGCFIKRGTVHNKRMKGGVSDELSLTAFVVIAMLEAGIPRQDYSVQKALGCLEERLNGLTEVYTVAILSYALALAGSDGLHHVIAKLDDVATRSDGDIYWSSGGHQNGRSYFTASSSDVEMTAYALLAKLVHIDVNSNIDELFPIVRWLTQQRNAYGGFSSTQDTVLALQALSVYGELFYSDVDMTLEFHVNDSELELVVDATNKLVLQRIDITTLPDTVTVDGKGEGCALLQANVKYNVPESAATPMFDLRVNVSIVNTIHTPSDVGNVSNTEQTKSNVGSCRGSHKAIQICTRYLGEDESSNMAVIETKMASGYYPDKISLKAAKKATDSMARFDVDGNKVFLYFDEIGHELVCFVFVVERVVNVEDVKPGWVTVYDYYDIDTSATVTYDICQYVEIDGGRGDDEEYTPIN